MNDQKQPVRKLFLLLVKHAGNFFGNVLIFLLTAGSIGILASFIRGCVEWLCARDLVAWALAFVLVVGVLWFLLVHRLVREAAQEKGERPLPGAAAGLVVAAATNWIYVFATLSYALWKLGAFPYTFASGPSNALADLCDAYGWHIFDLIPVFDIPVTFRWGPADVDLTGGWSGAILVLFRAVIVYQVFDLWMKLYWDRGAPKSADTAGEKPALAATAAGG